MLRKGKISDVNILARIHFLELRSDFLPSLGESFLRLLYLNLLQSENTYIWVAYSDGHIQGFVVGSKDFSTVFKKIIVKNFMKYALLILPQILKKPSIVKNVLETLLYTKKVGANTLGAELIVIAVLKKYRRKGLGRNLVFVLERDFLFQGIKKYKMSVSATNSVANSFYKSLDFKKSHDFFLYGKKINLYTKQIK